MANQAITQLPVAQTLTGSEQTVVVQNGVTKQASVSQIANAASPGKLITAVELDQTDYDLIFYYSDGTQSQTGPIPGYENAYIDGSGDLILVDTLGNLTNVGLVAATVAVGTTTTGLPGTNASVVNVGTAGASVLNFTIPRGDKGEQGDPGATGTFSAGTTGFTPNTPTTGDVVLGGTLNVSNGGTGTTTLTGYVKGNGTSAMSASATVPTTDLSGTITNAQLANSAITINGTSTSLGGSINVGTVTAVNGTAGRITSTGGTTPTIDLAGSVVTPGTTGSATAIPVITVDQYGRVTNVTTASNPQGTVTSVSGTGSVNGITLTGTVTSSGDLTLGGTLSNIGNSQLTNSSVTYNGQTVALGGSGTITAANPNALTIGTGLSGTSYDGSSAVTIAIDSTVATLTGAQELTNKTINGSLNTLSNIANSSLTNSSVTFNGQSVALGGSGTITASTTNALTIGTGLTGTSFNGSAATTIAIDSTVATLTGTQTLTGKTISGSDNTLSNIANSSLTNSQITLGTTNIALGGTSLTPAGLTSVTVTQNPTADFELATKQYVDGLVSSGITYHAPVKYEVPDSTGNLNATYNQPGGPGVGVGATLTNAGTLAAFAPDGPTASPGDRVLVYNQTNQFENGIYTVTTVGDGSTAWVLTRATDADTYGIKSPSSLGNGDAFFITSGLTGAGETYVCNTVGTITFGTTAITFVQISDSTLYTAGTGLTLTGTQFSISNTAVTAASYGSASKTLTATVNAQGQLTALADTNIAIANTQVSGLGTMSTQNANSVTVTGGNIDGTIIGATTAAAGTFTTVTATTGIFGGTF
jgi:hypothetical protein